MAAEQVLVRCGCGPNVTLGIPVFQVPAPSFEVLAKCAAVAVTGSIGHYLIYSATVRASAAVVAPMTYVQLIVAALIGIIWFKDRSVRRSGAASTSCSRLMPVLWALGLLAADYLFAFLAITFTFGIFVSVATLILEEVELRRFPKTGDLIVLTIISILENFGYRQISNFWRIRGDWQFLRKKQGWGQMTRKGFQTS